tara:strand:- start:54459 stop:55481 length:1023 start_codon:yes stop_codon:yes gene_type:complete
LEGKDKYPLITVLMPCFNAEKYVEQAVDSILNQTYSNLEVLCIDDGSQDETLVILERLKKKDARLRIIRNEQNLKLITTLNKGLKLAKGDYIARMDADDISYPHRIKLLYGFLINNNLDLASCNVDFLNMNGKRLGENYLKCHSQEEIELSSYFFTPIAHAAILVRKDVMMNHFYSTNEEALHVEDYELWTRMIRNGIKMSNLSDVLYSVRINDESVSSKFEHLQRSNFVKCGLEHQGSILGYEPEIKHARIAMNRINNASLSDMKKGFELIDEVYKKFCNGKESSQLRLIIILHKIDILINTIKLLNLVSKTWAVFKISGIIISNFGKSGVRSYLRHKL